MCVSESATAGGTVWGRAWTSVCWMLLYIMSMGRAIRQRVWEWRHVATGEMVHWTVGEL